MFTDIVRSITISLNLVKFYLMPCAVTTKLSCRLVEEEKSLPFTYRCNSDAHDAARVSLQYFRHGINNHF